MPTYTATSAINVSGAKAFGKKRNIAMVVDQNFVIKILASDGTESDMSSASNVSTETFACPAAVEVNDAVYATGSGSVDQADSDGASTYPVIGFVQSKPTPTTCVLQYGGELDGFSGLTPGVQCLDGTPGKIVGVAPGSGIIQWLGFARTSTTLVIQLNRFLIEM